MMVILEYLFSSLFNSRIWKHSVHLNKYFHEYTFKNAYVKVIIQSLESIHNIFTLQTCSSYNYRKISVLDACRDIMVYEPKQSKWKGKYTNCDVALSMMDVMSKEATKGKYSIRTPLLQWMCGLRRELTVVPLLRSFFWHDIHHRQCYITIQINKLLYNIFNVITWLSIG
jgi:hypothetical protein